MRLVALILARGKPLKGGHVAAEKMSLHGKAVVDYSLDVLRHHGETVVITESSTTGEGLEDQVLKVLRRMSLDSAGAPDFVLQHDATRPLITHQSVRDVIYLLLQGKESVTASVKSRDSLWSGDALFEEAPSLQTPEGFPFAVLLKAHEWRSELRRSFASGAELVASCLGASPSLVPLAFSNNRIETLKDMAAVEGILKFGQETIAEDPRDLEGLHVLVLGGSGGIGKACIELLEELGATYHAPSRQELDLRDEHSYPDLGNYHAVIHTAGEYEASPDDIMRVNFFSCLNLLSQVENRQWRGNIVFISSSASTWGRSGIPVYSASKAALNALVESESNRLATKGIIVNVVAPAKVSTRLQSIINPSQSSEMMLSPRYVARIVMRYLHTNQSGCLVFLRNGLDAA